MTETESTERFVIEVSRTGTVDHVVDLEADPEHDSRFSPRRHLPGEKLCDRSSRSPASEYIELPDYADWQGVEKTAFEGDAPDEICSYCWSDVLELLDKHDQHADEDMTERIGTVGYRLRWKQKGRAREEWYDLVVRPDTTMAELDSLVCRFTTLDDFHMRMYGLEDEYMDSSLGVLPDHQYDEAGNPSDTRASEVTIAEVADRAMLWEGDRLSLIYDFGTPSHFYCIVKEIYEPDEIDEFLQGDDVIVSTATAAIVKEKRP